MIRALLPEHRARTLIFVAVAVILAIGVAIIGIEDNAIGISLAMLSAASFVVSIVHPWRESSKFKRLIGLDIVVFFVLLLVGIPLSILGDTLKAGEVVTTTLGFVGMSLTLTAGFVCLPSFFVGLVGVLVTRGRERAAKAV